MQVILDARRMDEKESCHVYLQEMLGLPEYYGGNLDALYDCLTELEDTEIVIEHSDEVENYFRKVYHVFMGAARENDGLQIRTGGI